MKKFKCLISGLVTSVLWAVPFVSLADYQAGKEAFDRKDYATALQEFKALVEKKDALGQYGLGIMYDLGEGVPQDSEEAVKWYKRSAEQGNPDAQNNLGAMYEIGEGIPRDSKEAVKWYQRAAEQGNFDAPNNLGAMYLAGMGIPRNFVRAYMWFDLAVRKGDQAAVKNINFVKNKMTPDQIAEAQHLAKEWLEIYHKK